MPFIEVAPNVNLFVEDTGASSHGTFVFIHGWPMSSKAYEYQFVHLAQLGYRCVGIDLRGFGQSDKPWSEYNYDVFANDIKKVLEVLALKNVILAGHSMGGAISLHYVALHKAAYLKKLVLIGAAAPSFIKRTDFDFGIERSVVEDMITNCLSDRPKLLTRFGEMCFCQIS